MWKKTVKWLLILAIAAGALGLPEREPEEDLPIALGDVAFDDGVVPWRLVFTSRRFCREVAGISPPNGVVLPLGRVAERFPLAYKSKALTRLERLTPNR